MALGKSLHLSELQFPHPEMGLITVSSTVDWWVFWVCAWCHLKCKTLMVQNPLHGLHCPMSKRRTIIFASKDLLVYLDEKMLLLCPCLSPGKHWWQSTTVRGCFQSFSLGLWPWSSSFTHPFHLADREEDAKCGFLPAPQLVQLLTCQIGMAQHLPGTPFMGWNRIWTAIIELCQCVSQGRWERKRCKTYHWFRKHPSQSEWPLCGWKV